MYSYGIGARLGCDRYDSFNRQLAEELTRREAEAETFETRRHVGEKRCGDSSANWMRRRLAGVKTSGASGGPRSHFAHPLDNSLGHDAGRP